MSIEFNKYHCLGNDYLVIEPEGIDGPLTMELVRFVCDRHIGIGSDGVLFGPLDSAEADFGLRIFNPDGSEAEKSGNGLRIFSRYLWDRRKVNETPFTVAVPGGIVRCEVQPGGQVVKVWLGRVTFSDAANPTGGPAREERNELLDVGGDQIRICALTMGNPHCVVLDQEPGEELARRLGPQIENHRRFPNRTNVQFLKVRDRLNLEIQIWERGAGYTLASGSSACAATASAYRLGWCEAQVTVHMPGGNVNVEISADGMIILTGPVKRVCEGKAWRDE